MRQRVFIVCFASLFIAQTAPLFATLDSFKNTVEASESVIAERHNYANSSVDYGLLAESITQLLLLLWLPENYFFTYGPYPYAEEKFIQRPSKVDIDDFDFNKKNYSFSVGLSAFHLGGIGAGSWFAFSGNIFKFFGPYLDAYIIADTKQFLGGCRAGLHFSLIQSNFYNLACYAQWQGWGGTLSRNSFVTGLDTRLYPVKPLSIRFKAGFQLFENLSISELEGEIGVMLKAWEFYIGYRYWGLTDEHFATSPWHGPYLGIRTYF